MSWATEKTARCGGTSPKNDEATVDEEELVGPDTSYTVIEGRVQWHAPVFGYPEKSVAEPAVDMRRY